jgi:hypothetical protein
LRGDKAKQSARFASLPAALLFDRRCALLSFQQLRQLRRVGRNPPRLMFREQAMTLLEPKPKSKMTKSEVERLRAIFSTCLVAGLLGHEVF